MRKKVSTLADYEQCKQFNLLKYIDTLEEKEKEKIIEKLESVNIQNLFNVYTHYSQKTDENQHLDPIKNILRVSSTPSSILHQYEKIGYQLISEGKVCIAMMAGGQGTRLGFNKAKGMYDIGLPSHKTLFQIFCERILSLQNFIYSIIGKCLPIQFFIMTSDVNHEETTQFFLENNYFGLQSDQITFFQQDSLPILSINGDLLFSTQTTILEGPDGNGGLFGSLYNQGYIDYMKCLGIKYIHICPVDNVLCKLADPIWVGYIESENLTICSKFVKKANAEEKVGIHALINGKPSVIEYSEMKPVDLRMTNDKGELIYDAGGIAQMMCTVEFTYQIITDPETRNKLAAKYHVAQKKYEYFDFETKEHVVPTGVNCLKFELFFFDCFPLCQKEQFGLIEVLREDEFGPVKNAPGEKSDTPESAKQLYLQRDRRWLNRYGFKQSQETEISSNLTYFGEGLEKILPRYQGSSQNPLIIHNNKQLISVSSPNMQTKQPQKTHQPQQQQQGKQPQLQQPQKHPQPYIPQVVYQPLLNSVQLQPQPHYLQQNYYPYQSIPIQPKPILVQENPIHQSQIINPRLSLQPSTQQLTQIKASAFPIQNIPMATPVIKQSSIVTFNQPRYQQQAAQRVFSPKQTSQSPNRLTLYSKPRAVTVQRPTMFVSPRPFFGQPQMAPPTYCHLMNSIKK